MTQPPAGDFRDGMPFLGGRLWIDLVNAKSNALGDLIASPDGWRKWTTAAELEAYGAAETEEVAEIVELRGALSRLFDSLVDRRPAPEEAVATVNRHLRKTATFPEISSEYRGLACRRVAEESIKAGGRIAADFAEFVAGGFEPSRLRRCSGEDCSLIFYDSSRNGARRWCSMEVCGNRSKVRSHRARKSDGE